MGKWQTYKNERYQFSLEYPTNWGLGEPETNNAGREFLSPGGNTTCYAYGFANALTGKRGEPQTLDEFVSWMTSTEEEDMKIIEENEASLSGKKAVLFHSSFGGGEKDAIYSLGTETGIGLYCVFSSAAQREKDKDIFYHMVESMKINLDLGSNTTAVETCQNLLSGTVTPLKDLQTFTDTIYTEVTTTSRESWDKERLPQKVVDLENQSYSCLPTPSKLLGNGDGEVNAQPEVTEVEWKCELNYIKSKYLENGSPQQSLLEKEGCICKKVGCTQANGLDSSVLLCTK